MTLCGSAFRTHYVVFKFVRLHRQVFCAAFRVRIVCTHYWNWNLIVVESGRHTDNSRFVHCPAFEMREFKASRDFVGASLGQQTHFWPRRMRLYDRSQNRCDPECARCGHFALGFQFQWYIVAMVTPSQLCSAWSAGVLPPGLKPDSENYVRFAVQFRRYRRKHRNAGGHFRRILCKRRSRYPRASICQCHHTLRRKWFFGRDI